MLLIRDIFTQQEGEIEENNGSYVQIRESESDLDGFRIPLDHKKIRLSVLSKYKNLNHTIQSVLILNNSCAKQ